MRGPPRRHNKWRGEGQAAFSVPVSVEFSRFGSRYTVLSSVPRDYAGVSQCEAVRGGNEAVYRSASDLPRCQRQNTTPCIMSASNRVLYDCVV